MATDTRCNLTLQLAPDPLFPTNHSNTNSSQSAACRYVFPLNSLRARMAVAALIVLSALLCLIANILVLHLKRNERPKIVRAFSRCLTDYFVQSLSLCYALYSIVSSPFLVTGLFVNYITSDWACRLVRYLTILFVLITLFNMFIISTERFLATFYPFHVPTKRSVKRLVVGAWLFGVLVLLIPTMGVKSMTSYNLHTGQYTTTCQTMALYKVTVIAFNVLMFFIPGIVLITLSACVFYFLRSRKLLSGNSNLASSWRFKNTIMFLSVILTFVLPYIVPLTFLVVINALRIEATPELSAIFKYVAAISGYLNGVGNAFIYVYYMRETRRQLFHLGRRLCCPCRVRTVNISHSKYDTPAVAVEMISFKHLQSVTNTSTNTRTE